MTDSEPRPISHQSFSVMSDAFSTAKVCATPGSAIARVSYGSRVTNDAEGATLPILLSIRCDDIITNRGIVTTKKASRYD
jgi:hypothetical protein